MRSDTVFVDTGAWFAGIDTTDQHYVKASQYLKQLFEQGTPLVTSNFVVNETAMLLSRKLTKERAIAFLNTVRDDPVVQVIEVDRECERAAHRMFEKYADQDFSITDCTTFVLMESHKIKHAFTFDHHFDTVGISREPHT